MFWRTNQRTGVPGDTGVLRFAPHKGTAQQETAVGQQSTNKTLGNESNPKFLMFSQKKLWLPKNRTVRHNSESFSRTGMRKQTAT